MRTDTAATPASADADRDRPPPVPVAAIHEPAGEQRAEHVADRRPDEDEPDAGVVGADTVAQRGQRRTGERRRQPEEDEPGRGRPRPAPHEGCARSAHRAGRARSHSPRWPRSLHSPRWPRSLHSLMTATIVGVRLDRVPGTPTGSVPAVRVLMVLAHPDPQSFSHALATAAADALRSRRTRRGAPRPVRRGLPGRDERRRTRTPTTATIRCSIPCVQAHIDDVRSAEALVFVYPTWWSTLPAILKGWLERVMVPGVGFRFNDAGRVAPGLAHVRRLFGISTYGSSAPISCGRRTTTAGGPLPGRCGCRWAAGRARPGWRCTASTTARRRNARRSSGASPPRWPGCEGARHRLPPGRRVVPVGSARPRARRPCRRRCARCASTTWPTRRFRAELSVDELRSHRIPLRPGDRPDLDTHVADLRWCDTLVLVYPTWWSGQPAALTGWFDRVLCQRRRVGAAPRQHPIATAAGQRPPARRGHHPRFVEADQHRPGRAGQAGAQPLGAGDAPWTCAPGSPGWRCTASTGRAASSARPTSPASSGR